MEEAIPGSGDKPYTYTKNPTLIIRLVLAGVVLCFAWSLAALAADIAQFLLFHHTPLSHATFAANATRELVADRVMLALAIVTDILFLRWIYVMSSNCHGFGAADLTFSPGWSVGLFFVPGLNLFMPILILREIRRASKNPEFWKSQSGGWLPAIWWMLWIGGGIFAFISNLEAHSIHSLLELQQLANTILLARWLQTIAWGALFFLVRDIAKHQGALVSSAPASSTPVSAV